MKKRTILSISLTQTEAVYGICWLVIVQLLLPALLISANAMLGTPLSSAQINFLYYLINFTVTAYLFRHFLAQSWKLAVRNLFPVIWYAILGYLGCDFFTELINSLLHSLDPSFFNANNANVFSLLREEFVLMAVGTVLLVPVAEELLYRGAIFRRLYDRSPVWAYVISILLFAAIHVLGYIGTYTPVQLLLAMVQYIPAGYCLCWCYCQTDTIITPILMHSIVNAATIYSSVR